MRLCRFFLDDVALAAFYDDHRIIPIHQASERYGEETGKDLIFESTDDLLDFLPPDGRSYQVIRVLADWIEQLEEETLEELALEIDDVKLLVPIARPPKILLLAGNYAAHVIERGGVAVERTETFPYVFTKPPSTTLTHPCDPIRIPKISPDHVDWECELGVVIGRHCRDVDENEALDYVAGYTVINDIYRPQVSAQPRPQAARSRPLLRLAPRQVARHVLPGRPLHLSRRTRSLIPRASVSS